MNDYTLRILAKQRQEEILASVRAAQRSQLERSSITRMNKSIRLIRIFFAQWTRPMVLHLLTGNERKSL